MSSTFQLYGLLTVAVALEVVATSFLKQSAQFTNPTASVLTLVFYGAAFYVLSITLKTIPVGIAYAIWSGLGIVLISIVGVVVFKQTLDLAAIIGLGLIIAGVIVVNLFSNSMTH